MIDRWVIRLVTLDHYVWCMWDWIKSEVFDEDIPASISTTQRFNAGGKG